MEKRRCGNTDLELSILGAGCWAFGGGEYWGHQNQKDVEDVVHKAVELGINYFDTAESYNEGRSEKSLGLAIKNLPREKIILGTKVSPSNTYPGTLEAHCEASIKRLRVDYIDLYMIHWPIYANSIRHFTNDENIIQNPPSVSDAIETLLKLKEQGKIRYIGVSNFAKNRLKELLHYSSEIVVNELPYSLLTRAVEYDIFPFCQQQGLSVIGYMALLQGLLADIYPTLEDVPKWQRRTRHFSHKHCDLCRHGEEGAEEETNQTLAEIRRIAKEQGMSMPALAIKWVLSNLMVTCSLVGARNNKELELNVKAAAEPLPADLIENLNKITEPLLKKLGHSFDYYESVENNRTC
jgi:aryl-alcohol dehydrogenase-like predicted oxidoreductase